MGTGGSYYKGNSSNGGGHRGRPYGLMLLLAFGLALVGVMVLHKFRERRIFNLLVKEKDRDLFSLRFLLQKERDYTKEMTRKNQEMKAMMYSLRTQNMELDRMILEKQSTIDSLKDEQRTIESAVEEKQNEIKMLREKEIDPGNENPQVIALMESLKQKETEIEGLKRRLEYPVKVWSVSTDDPSSPPVNLTVIGNMAGQDKTELIKSKGDSVQLNESTNNYRDGENLTSEDGSENKLNNFREAETTASVEDGKEIRAGDTDKREMTGEQTQKLENSKDDGNKNGSLAIKKTIDEGQGKKNEDSQDGGGVGIVQRDNDVKIMDVKEYITTGDGQLGKLENSQGGESQEHDVVHKGSSIKLEEPDNSNVGTSSRMRGKHGRVSKTKGRGRRWRMLVKNRLLENNGNSVDNGAVSLRSRKFFTDEQRNERAASNKGEIEREGVQMGDQNPMEVIKAVDSSDAKILKPQNLEDGKDPRNMVVNADTNHQVVNGREMLENPRHSLNEDVQLLKNNSGDGEGSKIVIDTSNQKLDEARQSDEHEASDIQLQTNSTHVNEVENDAEQEKVGDTHKLPEDLKVANIQESDAAEGEGDFFRESSSNSEDEEYKEETDESEF